MNKTLWTKLTLYRDRIQDYAARLRNASLRIETQPLTSRTLKRVAATESPARSYEEVKIGERKGQSQKRKRPKQEGGTAKDRLLPASFKANTGTMAHAPRAIILPRSGEVGAVLLILAFPAFLQRFLIERTAQAPPAALPAFWND